MVMDRGLTASGWCGLKPDLGSGSSLQKVACNMFDENPSSDSEEWRSPNHILEITIRKAFYPITESVLRQIFDRFGVVQQVHLIGGLAQVLARVVFSSKHEAADAFGELHGRNIYDGCSQMDINWGLSQELGISIATRDVDRTTSLASVQFSSASDAMSTQYRTFQEHVVTMDKSIAYSVKSSFSASIQASEMSTNTKELASTISLVVSAVTTTDIIPGTTNIKLPTICSPPIIDTSSNHGDAMFLQVEVVSGDLNSKKLCVENTTSGAHTTTISPVLVHSDICVTVPDVRNCGSVNSLDTFLLDETV